jgi:hypothetical protein
MDQSIGNSESRGDVRGGGQRYSLAGLEVEEAEQKRLRLRWSKPLFLDAMEQVF